MNMGPWQQKEKSAVGRRRRGEKSRSATPLKNLMGLIQSIKILWYSTDDGITPVLAEKPYAQTS
jgi:hypothetical protein